MERSMKWVHRNGLLYSRQTTQISKEPTYLLQNDCSVPLFLVSHNAGFIFQKENTHYKEQPRECRALWLESGRAVYSPV